MPATIGSDLAQRLETARDYDVFEVTIFLSSNPASEVLSDPASAGGRQARIARMQELAESSQQPLLAYLRKKQEKSMTLADGTRVPQVAAVEAFWVNNAVKAEVTREVLDEILDRDDVSLVELVHHADISELLDGRVASARRRTGPAGRSGASRAGAAAATVTWSVRRINAPLLWQKKIDGKGVLVAVVDTGVNYNHPDLKSQMWKSAQFPHHGFDFASNDDDPIDSQGHGTCCAGIVAGNGAKGKATGVAPKATIMAIRVGGTETQFWRGLQFAIAQGAHVISMSMTWKYPSHPDYPGWRRTCEAILAAGILHANSIGNQGDQLATYPIPYNIATPGNCPPPRLHPLQIIRGGLASPFSCGATSSTDALANYSGRGPAAWETGQFTDYPYQGGVRTALLKPDLCAPGPGTESCNYAYPSSSAYVSFGGTSAATPHVAGCLALLACACLRSGTPIVPGRIQEALENTAVRIPGQTSAKENHYGAGRVDVKAAYDYGAAKGWWTAAI